MASFSFGAGNAAKLLRIPLYAAGCILTAIVPRSRDEWVFGCGAGIGDGALALWQRAADASERAVWLVGSETERADAARHGIPSIPKHSVRGLWRTARARVIVITHGFGDVNRYAAAGAYVVQLWHGIPLKRLGLDSPATTRSDVLPGSRTLARLIGLLYRGAQRRISLLPAASHLVRGRLESAFGLPDDRVRVTGEPRVDVLSRGSGEERRTRARARLEELVGPCGSGVRLVLYAPTWRDGAPDPAVPDAAEWAQLQATLDAHDAVLLVRSHPLGAGDYTPPAPTARVRGLGSAVVADVTPLLPGLDVLVTDYSSLLYDVGLVPLPVVFLAPDADAYGLERGFYGTYAEVAGPDPATSWSDAVSQLAAVLGDAREREGRVERSRALSAHVHDYDDGGNTDRVYRTIRAALDAGTAARSRRVAKGAR
ncbi:CDP-glycerol glycerophosphotransferase family protein [Microbacterium sp.]|uniref:CDP-glycerol glycerophosphotransferase family protein n=1 Tax=Microbacterium sp. TaxID=51671 RepID=UPI0039E3F4A3